MSDEMFNSHLEMEKEWNSKMDEYTLRDWRHWQSKRQNKRSENVDDQDQEKPLAAEDIRRPPHTNSELVAMAIRNSPQMRCTVQEICHFVEVQFPYYRDWDLRPATRRSVISVLCTKRDFLKTTDYEIGKNGRRRYYYSFRPVQEVINDHEENCLIYVNPKN